MLVCVRIVQSDIITAGCHYYAIHLMEYIIILPGFILDLESDWM